MQPFSNGMIGASGFNAVMDAERAKKISRTLDGQQMKFYYNPKWHLMEDSMYFDPESLCINRQHFIEKRKDIISSDKINKKFEVLYSKATF